MAGFATLLGGGLAGLAGANAQGGATAAQNEALNNSGAPQDVKNSAEKGGVLSQIGDAANAFIDRVKWTYSDPVGDISRWVSQFGGLVQSGAQQTMSQSPWSLAAQGISNGLSAVMGAGDGLPPAGPNLAPAGGPGIGSGQTVPLATGGTPPNAMLASGNGGDDTGSGARGQGSSTGNGNIQIDDSRAGHIFRDSDGHISDTPANRQLLESVANDPSAVLGTDKYGTTWAAKTNPDGTQTWVGIRGGKVSYGGINQTPKSFNSQTGLASPTRPGT
ncbi:hypothetical protein [Trinickia diaoshuihuensis]|uniref:hypothetical protein n=1 Tax=Trinickia diaoshuihuensis TaxID=2292265 RepID=UPI001F0772A3|nr:hypothetical protein [Trinickia diaoshuihuensis]